MMPAEAILEIRIPKIPIIAPDQKAKTVPKKIIGQPKNQPKPIANFASPKPINLPPDNNQNKPKGKEITRPERKSK